MRFLADMGIGMDVADSLRQAGHSSAHLLDEGLERLPDSSILEKAREENRIILTHDLDFGRLLAVSGRDKPSLITFRLSDMRPASVTSHLMTVLVDFHEELAQGAALVVTDKGVRCRRLPIR